MLQAKKPLFCNLGILVSLLGLSGSRTLGTLLAGAAFALGVALAFAFALGSTGPSEPYGEKTPNFSGVFWLNAIVSRQCLGANKAACE